MIYGVRALGREALGFKGVGFKGLGSGIATLSPVSLDLAEP